MGSLIPDKPKLDVPSQPPPAPTVANSQGALDFVARQQALRMGRGRAATMVNPGGGAGIKTKGTLSSSMLGSGAPK